MIKLAEYQKDQRQENTSGPDFVNRVMGFSRAHEEKYKTLLALVKELGNNERFAKDERELLARRGQRK